MKKFLMGLLVCVMVFGSVMTVSAAPQSFDGVMFDPEFYAVNNPDVVAVVGNNADLLFAHYMNFGVNEGRAPFDPISLSDDAVTGAIEVNKPAPVVPGVTPCLPLTTKVTPENLEQAYLDELLYLEITNYIEPFMDDLGNGPFELVLTDDTCWQLAECLRYASGATAGFPNGSEDYDLIIDKVEKNSNRQYTIYLKLIKDNMEAKSIHVVDFDKAMCMTNLWQLSKPTWTPIK